MSRPGPPRSVAVVGGGITGLAAAYFLATIEPRPPEITLFERDPQLGGKIRTVPVGDGWVEAGPDSFLARESWVEDLCRAVGLGDELVAPAVFGASVWVRGRLRRFPAGSFWGMPASARAALAARALTRGGRLRALGDLVVPGPLRGPDVPVADFVSRRFGKEVLDRLVDPLLAGTRAGRTDEMSLAAALPQVDAVARAHRSIMRGAPKALSGETPPFLSVEGGMGRLVERLEAYLDDKIELKVGTGVDLIAADDDGFRLVISEGIAHTADAVIVCTPAPAAAKLLQKLDSGASDLLGEIEYSSVASVSLVYKEPDLRIPEGTSGVLVPHSERQTISGCTWWSTKWPLSLGEAGARRVVRCFVGEETGDPVPEDDDGLVAACHQDVSAIAGPLDPPLEGLVTRWEQGLPKYRVGHLDLIDEIDRELSEHPRLALAGAGLRGSGLPDCIKQARAAAAKIRRV